MPKKELKIPQKITLKEILEKLKADEKDISKLTSMIQETRFFDNIKKYEKTDKNTIKLTNTNIVTGEDNYIYINLKDSTLEYHEITNGIKRIRKYAKNGIDLSLINKL